MDLYDDPRYWQVEDEIKRLIKSGKEPEAFSVAYDYTKVFWQPVFPEKYKEAVMSDPAIQENIDRGLQISVI